MGNNENQRKKQLSENKWVLIFAILCLLVVAGAVFATIFYINIIQTALSTPNSTVGIQSSTDILNLSIPILAVFAGLIVSFLGLKKFENIDEKLENMNTSLVAKHNEKVKDLQEFQQQINKEFGDEKERILQIKSDVKADIELQIKEMVHKNLESALQEVDKKIIELSKAQTEYVTKTSDTMKKFDTDYRWLLEHKNDLDKIEAANIATAYRLIEKEFNSQQPDISKVMAIVDYVLKNDEVAGDENEYHNLASELARNDFYDKAAAICAKATQKLYPHNVDLISGVIHYNAKIGEMENAEDAAQRLNDIPKKYWNWRAFTFLIDYRNALSATDENMEHTLSLVKDYQHCLKHEEKAYMAEFETCLKYGMHDEAIQALIRCVDKLKMAPQCAMRLADYYLEIGEYDHAIESATKAIIGNAEDQQSVNTGAIFACRGFSKDAKIHERLLNGESSDNMHELILDAKKDLILSLQFGFIQSNIRLRIQILESLLDDVSDNSIPSNGISLYN